VLDKRRSGDHRDCGGGVVNRRKSCRHPGLWSWFTPLNRGHTRVFCVGCAKWADEIRAAGPRADAIALQRQLDGAK